MFNAIIQFSLSNKLLVLLGVLVMVILGIFSASRIPLDAVPDITNNQVQIVSTAPTLAPQEVEQLITYPLEATMTNIPGVVEVRSISRYGLSVITVVFEESTPIMLARQYVQEQLSIARGDLPTGIAETELMPITTGLGEIYQYVLTVDSFYQNSYDATKLRTIQDWIVKRQLNGTKGIIEVSSFGGYLKQYEVSVNPHKLKALQITLLDVIQALEVNNENSGGSYLEKGPNSFYIRIQGRTTDLDAIRSILIKNRNDLPITLGDIATINIGSAKRYGAMTMDGKGEVVGGITLMLKGANSSQVLQEVEQRMQAIESTLPPGVHIYPYLDRSKLIGKTIHTVQNNLVEGGLIVIFVLLLLLGNLRAGLIVASVIPLSMLFALILMRYFGVSANLMSLGAIDFGIIVDGAVIIVESLLHTLTIGYLGQRLSKFEMDQIVEKSASQIYRSAAFGVLIILVVFIPILTLEGTEGKTFRPMAQTVGFAIVGSLLLALTYVPVMSSLFLNKKIKPDQGIAYLIINSLKRIYRPILTVSLARPFITLLITAILFFFSLFTFNQLGSEFIPTLEEGDIAMQQSIKPGSSLEESIRTSSQAEQILLQHFPEVLHVVSKIGTAEVPTDPMAIEDADIMIILKDKEEWTSASNRVDLMAKMKAKLAPITWASFEFTQPIQLRFNELMTGAKSDISVKLFGEDVDVLKDKADEAALIIQQIPGAGDVKVDQTDGLQQLLIEYDRQRMAQYGIQVMDVNQIIRAAYAGEVVGDFFEQERKFDLVVRLAPAYRKDLDLNALTIQANNGQHIALNEIASITQVEGPMLISREQARRFINIGINVRGRDIASLVEEIQKQLAQNYSLPPGYEIQYGGQFENLENARNRLLIAVPIALGMIFLLLYLAFSSSWDAIIIFMAVPFSAIGGIWALWLRSMPFSISSGIGFIALFGVSVLNGIVLVSAIRQLESEEFSSYKELIQKACLTRLRPVLITALVAALGFLPMALSTGNGAEVQRPLATVVIGGLISSTLLTLIVLPTLYSLIFNRKWMSRSMLVAILLLTGLPILNAQSSSQFDAVYDQMLANHPSIKNVELAKQQEKLELERLIPWEPLEIDYQGGQIQFAGPDHLININQDISPLFRGKERKTRKALTASRIALLSKEQQLQLKELKLQLQLAFNDYYYWYSKTQLQDSLYQIYVELEPKVAANFEVGTIDVIEMELFLTEKLLYQQQAQQSQQQQTASDRLIRQISFIDDSWDLNPKELEVLRDTSLSFKLEDNSLLQVFTVEKNVISNQALLMDQTAKQARIHLGYFVQSLENEFVFQGLNLGFRLPIDNRTRRVKSQQFQLQQLQVDHSIQAKQHALKEELNILENQLQVLGNSIQQFQDQAIQKQERLLFFARQQYEQGELDFLKFSQIQERILTQQHTYLDLVKAYNETLLNIQFITQP